MALSNTSIPTIAGARRMLDSREISVSELVELCLSQVETLQPACHAFTSLTQDAARVEAKQRQDELDSGSARSPLHGIPVGLKDIYETKGVATTANSALLQSHVPQSDAATVALLAQAGAISLGKLATWEFAIGGPQLRSAMATNEQPVAHGFRPRRFLLRDRRSCGHRNGSRRHG